MIISPWLIYFADLMDSIGTSIGILLIVIGSIVITITLCNGLKSADDDCHKIKWGTVKRLMTAFFIILLAGTFIPSSKTFYKMLIIPTVVNSSVVQKLPNELQKFIDKELKVSEIKKGNK